MDLAEGHVRALEYAFNGKAAAESTDPASSSGAVESTDPVSSSSAIVFNLGTGRPYSVLEVIRAFEKASGKELPYRIGPRREGDIADVWADVKKAKEQLGWEAGRDLEDMCRDSWNWQIKNPEGYR